MDPAREVDLGNNMMVKYYLSEFTNPDDNTQVVYELHGMCVANKVDYKSMVAGDTITCDMGFYYETDDVDWFKLKMEYVSDDSTASNPWTCEDGHSTSLDTYTKDDT